MKSLNSLSVAKENPGSGRFSGLPEAPDRDGPYPSLRDCGPMLSKISLDLLFRRIIAQASGEEDPYGLI